MKSKSERRKWWNSLTKAEQSAYLSKVMAAKAKKRTPEYRRKKYKERGYSDAEIERIMNG